MPFDQKIVFTRANVHACVSHACTGAQRVRVQHLWIAHDDLKDDDHNDHKDDDDSDGRRLRHKFCVIFPT